MIYGSVCSGIEAATVAWEPLGWKPAFFSEIDKFPRAVLQHHYPDAPHPAGLLNWSRTGAESDRQPVDRWPAAQRGRWQRRCHGRDRAAS